jgi:hypothetical protein
MGLLFNQLTPPLMLQVVLTLYFGRLLCDPFFAIFFFGDSSSVKRTKEHIALW